MESGLDVQLAMNPKASDPQSAGTLSLYFDGAMRPDADAIAAVIARSSGAGLCASISHRPQADADWVELLASGLTFDLAGLRPGDGGGPGKGVMQRYGFDDEPVVMDECVVLAPSGHITSGAGLLPVVRTMMGLAANLAMELPVRAIGWGPAETLMAPGYFCRSVLNWLGGGPFPGLGLTALHLGPEGLKTRGLAYFTGQEMQLQSRPGEPPATTAKLATRLIDRLVQTGRVNRTLTIESDGETLHVEPSQVGKLVLVWRADGHRG